MRATADVSSGKASDGRDCVVERLRARIVAIDGPRCGRNRALSGALGGRIYQELCPGVLRSAGNSRKRGAPMTLSVTHATEQASPLRGLLPLWVGVGIYVLFLLAGNRL